MVGVEPEGDCKRPFRAVEACITTDARAIRVRYQNSLSELDTFFFDWLVAAENDV